MIKDEKFCWDSNSTGSTPSKRAWILPYGGGGRGLSLD